jgi:hypothetical protein
MINPAILEIGKILKKELDNGDNDQIDGIFMAEKIARQIAKLMQPKDETAFLKSVRLSKLK